MGAATKVSESSRWPASVRPEDAGDVVSGGLSTTAANERRILVGPTLASKLGKPRHVSPLLQKLARGGIGSTTEMAATAVERGCLHYAGSLPTGSAAAKDSRSISDEELAIALLCPSNPYDPMLVRIGSQLLSKQSCKPEKLIALAKRERCEAILKYIAQAGRETEPESSVWDYLLTHLPQSEEPKKGVLPHKSRLRREVGVSNPQKPAQKAQWLRAK